MLFTGLSDLGAWISWIRPNNAVLSQVLGVKTGLGLFPLTLDWAQVVSALTSPMIVPWWTIWNVTLSFAFWVLIIIPVMYYTNSFDSAYFPIMSNSLYDITGNTYNVTRIISKNLVTNQLEFNGDAYNKYSPIYLPIAYIIQNGLSFAAISALVTTYVLDYRTQFINYIVSAAKKLSLKYKKRKENLKEDIRNESKADTTSYSTAPTWWYIIVCAVAFTMAMYTTTKYPMETPAYALIVFLIMGVALVVPVGILESTSTIKINYTTVVQIIVGYWYTGKPIALIQALFFIDSFVDKTLHFVMDLKLAHYYKVPPRTAFCVQLVGGIICAITNIGVVDWVLGHVPNVCTNMAKSGMICRYNNTSFNMIIIYGVVGPQRLFFNADRNYSAILWFFLLGALAPIPIHVLRHYKFNKHFNTKTNFGKIMNKFLSELSVPLFFSGATNIPAATGINYTTWSLVGFIFNYFLRHKASIWWRKYTFILSAALTTGTDTAVLVIYIIVMTVPSATLKWWGNDVANSGCDAKGCPYYQQRGQI